jgi:hypothetical protein
MPVKKKEGININIKVGESKAKPKRKVIRKPKAKVITKYLQPQQTPSLGVSQQTPSLGVSQPVLQTGLVRDFNVYTEEVNKRNEALKSKTKEEEKALEIEKKKEASMKKQLELRKGLGESEETMKAYEKYLKSPQKKGVMKGPFISKELSKEKGFEELGLKPSTEFYDYKKSSMRNDPDSLRPKQTKMGSSDDDFMRKVDELLK